MTFPLVGNSKIKQSLEYAIAARRIPHALLIEGDEGTGRHTLADFIAQATVCSGENPLCGSCKNCSVFISGNHPDVTTILPEEGKKSISVTQIRELKTETYVKPHMSAKRVFIIDKADTLNTQSQNALLKVLEEPPESVAFILIAESKASFLETVISRCVIFSLSVPETAVARDFISQKGNFNISDIEFALNSTNNNIGKALKLLNGEGSTKTAACAKDFLNAMLSGDLWGMLSASSIAEKNRIEADRFFKDLKQITALSVRQKPNGYQAKRLSLLYSKLCELEKNLDSNINLSLLCCLLASDAAEIKN